MTANLGTLWDFEEHRMGDQVTYSIQKRRMKFSVHQTMKFSHLGWKASWTKRVGGFDGH